MKKFLLLLIGVMVSVVANADEWSDKYVAFQIGDKAGSGDTPNEVKSQEHGKCEWKNLAIGTEGFTIKYWDGSKNTWYGGKTVDQNASNWPTLTEYTSNAQKAYVNGAKAGQKFDVIFYLNSKTINIVPVGGGDPTPSYDKIYFSYGINGSNNWTWSQEMNTSDGTTYTATVNNVVGNLRFFVHKNQGSSWDDVTGKNDNVYMISGPGGESSDDVTLGLNSNKQAWLYGTCKHAIKVNESGNLKVTFTKGNDDNYIKVEKVNGGGDDPSAPTTLYFQVKYDLEEYGTNGKNTPLYCYLYSDNGNNTWPGGQMQLVDEKYSIYKYDLKPEEIGKYNAVIFHFTKKDNGGEIRYDSQYYHYTNNDQSQGKVEIYDKNNWTRYIYATAKNSENKEYAIQSYLTYKEFKALDQLDIDNGGRRFLYIIGFNDNTEYCDEADNNTWKKLKRDMMASDKEGLVVIPQDHGCFYVPLRLNNKDASFKMSWINPYAALEGQTKNEARLWATFDLGLVGVDKESQYVTNINRKTEDGAPSASEIGKTPLYSRNFGTAGTVWFARNKSVPYMNYNQADWVMKSDIFGSGTYYLVVDTHTTSNGSDWDCKTASIVSFDPQPKVSATVNDFGAYEGTELSADDIAALQAEELVAAERNGHIETTNVNTAHGIVDIEGSDISDVQNAKFSRTYIVYVNGVPVVTANGATKNIDVPYLPLGGEDAISVRAQFEDGDTHLKFHSRTSICEMNATAVLAAPTAPTLSNARFVYEGSDGSNNYFGVYAEGLDVTDGKNEFKPTASSADKFYNVYTDFHFNDAEGNLLDTEILVDGSETLKLDDNIDNFTMATCTNWNDASDWSTHLLKPNSTHTAPVYIHRAVTVPDGSAPSLEDTYKFTCTVYAVYPFLYKPVDVNVEQQKASRREAAVDGLKLTLSKVPATSELSIKASNGIVSGIEGVDADAEAADAPVEYYTISGVLVQGEPAPGIYVRRQGSKVEKVVIR